LDIDRKLNRRKTKMLKVLGGIYGNTKDEFNEILKPLLDAGYVPGYNGDTSAMILKEVETLSDESENQES
jgi:hypothetical protein